MAIETIKLNKEAENEVETLEVLSKLVGEESHIIYIEFDDGSKEACYCKDKQDEEDAIKFAQTCINATNNARDAKELMYTGFWLTTKQIHPTEIVELRDGCKYYIDHHKGVIVNRSGETVAELQEDEKRLCDSGVETVKTLMTRLLVERANSKIEERYSIDYDYDYDDEDWDDEDYDD